MDHPPINPRTSKAIKEYFNKPGQSVGLIGNKWLNNRYIARQLAADLLEVQYSNLDNYPYILSISSNKQPSIGIDEIRSINDFILLKVPGKKTINRIIIIEDAERLTIEAQNALLKSLEEPPIGTIFILNSTSVKDLLDTITSRINIINVYKPFTDNLLEYYSQQGYNQDEIKSALLISDGMPGLMDELLTNKDNSIAESLTTARKLLSSTLFERLSSINELAKDKSDLFNIFFIIKQMAKIGLKSDDPKSASRWRKILAATLDAENKLTSNVQTKLLLTDYILNLS